MESTSVEDFQEYHNRQPVGAIDPIPDPSPRFHSDYIDSPHHGIDEDDSASLSGSAHHSPNEAIFDHQTRTSSPRTSDDEISILSSHYEPTHTKSPPFTPLKPRSPFRNPSSVRAMQMDTTPPHLASPSQQYQRPKLYATPSRQHSTPRSTRSHRNSAMSSPSKLSPGKKMKKEYPLVLLHVTLLPIPLHYSQEVLESVLPRSTLENWKMLQEKATDTVLQRGILIPHPKEDYDLLELRLLESLELKKPRILKCGHFHLEPEEEADIIADDNSDRGEEDANDMDICIDCGRRIRDGRYGDAGTGSKRWDIKLYAANGLMRAGAWGAAWREMERVDVEIVPWMEENMKRELELRKEEEEERRRVVEAEVAEVREEGVGGLDDERLREIYGGEAKAFVDGVGKETDATAEMARREMGERRREGEVPLWDLLVEYLRHAARDRRNIIIFLLSALVLLLSMRGFGNGKTDTAVHKVATQDAYSVPTPATPHTAIDSISSSSTEAVPIASTSTSPVDSTPITNTGPASTISSSTAEAPRSEEGEEEVATPWTEESGDEISELIED